MDSLVKLFLFFKFRIDHELRPLGIGHHLYISLPVAERGEDDPNAYSCLVRSVDGRRSPQWVLIVFIFKF